VVRVPSKAFKSLVGVLAGAVLGLSWLGSCPVEAPFVGLSQGFRLAYFGVFSV